MIIHYSLIFLTSILLPIIKCNSSENDEALIKLLIQWVRENNGIVNAKLGVRRKDKNSPLKFYARKNLLDQETLFTIPSKCSLISSAHATAPPGLVILPKVGDYVNVIRETAGGKEWYLATITFVDDPRSRVNVIFDDGEEDFLYGYDEFHTNGGKRRRGDVFCSFMNNVTREINLGDESEYAPLLNYVQYILKSEEEMGLKPNLPMKSWSLKGKELLWKIFQIERGLPSYYNTSHIFNNEPLFWEERDCTSVNDDIVMNLALKIQNHFGYNADILFPFFDLLSHRNGKVRNAQISIQSGTNEVIVRSTRVIEAGEDIVVSHYECAECSTDVVQQRYRNNYGTKNLLLDYGIMEEYPQRWLIRSNEYPSMKFIIGKVDQLTVGGNDRVVDGYVIRADSAELKSVLGLKGVFDQLSELKNTLFQEWDNITPRHEWDLIDQYLNAELIAVEHVLKAHANACNEIGLDGCHFDNLLAEEEDTETPVNLQLMACTFGKMMIFDEYTGFEEIQTPYQKLQFEHHPETKDACLTITPTVQICDSYRPQYHEMAVHYTAKYLKEDLKRVVFVGGGDSMLLHEVLKYPSLEVVVGLEIDQTVTRKSFKHFGTQPHWDNEKVEWWYGDAAKSLLMLPRSYFGSFDLILVDLSETVMSFTVTGEIDIMSALSLLLKPNGIFLKNEIYFEKLAKLFPYTLQIHTYEVPVVCSQALVLGSFETDFLAPIRAGEDTIEKLFTEPYEHSRVGVHLNEEDMLYHQWHDYRRNSTISKICKKESTGGDVEQEASPGILMILEAENALILKDPLTTQQLTVLLEQALNNLAKVKHVANELSFNDGISGKMTIVIILEEGYIIARVWTELQYVAFDVHLWSSFDKHVAIKNALINAVGSSKDSSSSYRIAAGGQFGVSTWREDAAKSGPSLICPEEDEEQTSIGESAVPSPNEQSAYLLSSNDLAIILEESLNTLSANDIKVGVLCPQSPQPCQSLEILKKLKNARELVEIRACPDMNIDNAESVLSCESEILHMLKESTKAPSDKEASAFFEIESDTELANGDQVVITGHTSDIQGRTKAVYATIQSLNVDGTINLIYDYNSEVEFHVPRDRIQLVRKDYSDDKNKIQVMVLDDTAPMIMGQILLNIFLNGRNMHTMLTRDNFLILSLFLSPTTVKNEVESNEVKWRTNIMKRFRTNVFMHDPVFEAEVVFNSTNSGIDMSITSTGDLFLIKNLKTVISTVKTKLSAPVDAYIQNIQAGHFNFQPNFNPRNFYLPKDYNPRPVPLKQWYDQKSLGRQTVFQLVKDVEILHKELTENDSLNVGDRVEQMYGEEWYAGTVGQVKGDGNYFITFDDGDEEDAKITELRKLLAADETPELSRSYVSKGMLTALSYIVGIEPAVCEGEDENKQCVSPESNNQKYEFFAFHELGDGSVFFFIWSGGSILVLWDGRDHVDLNLFTYDENEEIHTKCVEEFKKGVPFMKTILHDPQPRGVGRVVNFKDDLYANDDSENVVHPHWA